MSHIDGVFANIFVRTSFWCASAVSTRITSAGQHTGHPQAFIYIAPCPRLHTSLYISIYLIIYLYIPLQVDTFPCEELGFKALALVLSENDRLLCYYLATTK